MAEKPVQDDQELNDLDLELEGLDSSEEDNDNAGDANQDDDKELDIKADKDKKAKSDSEEPELTDVEQDAFSQGWRPKEQYVAEGGDPKSWRPADWWLDRGELLGQQRQTTKELRQIKEAFVRMSQANADAYLKGRADAVRQLKAQKRDALKEGDLVTVADLDEKIDATQEELDNVKNISQRKQEAQAVQPSQSYMQWLDRNRWYTTDPVMHNHANAFMQAFVAENKDTGITQEECLQALDKYIRQELPNKFKSKKEDNPVSQPNVDGRGKATKSGGQGNSGGSIDAAFAKIVSGMDASTRAAVISLIKDKHITKKEYVESYNS